MMKKFILGIALASYITSVNAADMFILNDRGGNLFAYMLKYNTIRPTDKIRISGTCSSACTMIMKYAKPEQICVDRGTKFGFHSASFTWTEHREHSPVHTKMMWDTYPEKVKEDIRKQGWDGLSERHEKMIYLFAADYYSICKT